MQLARERRNAFGCDVVRGHVGHRRTRRTRFGRARRGAGVAAGHCAAPASTRACRPWQVAGPGGANPLAGAPPVACHWPAERRTSPAMPSASLRVLVAPARPYLPQPTFLRAYKPAPAVPRAHALSPERGNHLPVAFLTHPRASALPCAPQHLPKLLVEQADTRLHRNPSSRGSRRAAASSSPLRHFSKPGDLPSASSGSHGSSPCSTWLSPGLALAAIQFPAGAPPLLRRRRSPEPSPVDPPPPIEHG
jgi:nucleoid-associated protein YgaU